MAIATGGAYTYGRKTAVRCACHSLPVPAPLSLSLSPHISISNIFTNPRFGCVARSSRNVALASLTISAAMYAAFRYMRARGERTGENERRFQAHGDVDPNKQTDQGTLRSAPGPRYKWNRGS